jgi:hypothetical protein
MPEQLLVTCSCRIADERRLANFSKKPPMTAAINAVAEDERELVDTKCICSSSASFPTMSQNAPYPVEFGQQPRRR